MTTPDHTEPSDQTTEPLSHEYYAKASAMDAAEQWELGDLDIHCAILRDKVPPDEWANDYYLPRIAAYRRDAVAWLRLTELYKALYGNVSRLEKAVDQLLQGAQQTNSQDTTPARFATISAVELLAKVLPPQQWIVPDILPIGATLFAGRGKDGKSLMMLNLCVAVATGGKALGSYDVIAGDVLYLALEDGERRAQERLRHQLTYLGQAVVPQRLEFVLWDAPRVGEGFEPRLLTWIDDHPAGRLVVVDILEKVRPKRHKNGSIYQDDYNAIAPLQRIAQERGIAVVIVHHSNKTRAEDFRDTASGSTGLIGVCDTFWSLQRQAGKADAVLHIIGRDVESQELAMQFKDGFWTVLGDAEEYRLTQASTAVLEALRTAGKPLTSKQLAKILAIPDTTIRQRLHRMAERGDVLALGDGRYIPSSPHTHNKGGGREGK